MTAQIITCSCGGQLAVSLDVEQTVRCACGNMLRIVPREPATKGSKYAAEGRRLANQLTKEQREDHFKPSHGEGVWFQQGETMSTTTVPETIWRFQWKDKRTGEIKEGYVWEKYRPSQAHRLRQSCCLLVDWNHGVENLHQSTPKVQ